MSKTEPATRADGDVLGPHYYVPVDDCTRCAYCECLIGSPEPCNANVMTQAEADAAWKAEVDEISEEMNRPW